MKKDCYYYVIKNREKHCWGEFLIFDDGLVVLHSDLENGVFRWCNWGEGKFIDWILDLFKSGDKHYWLGKMFPHNLHYKYQPEATYEHIKEHILLYRREDSYSSEFARKEYDLLNDYLHDADTPEAWLEVTNISDAWEMMCYDYSPCIYMVWDNFIPQLIQEIEKDLEAEKNVQE